MDAKINMVSGEGGLLAGGEDSTEHQFEVKKKAAAHSPKPKL